MFDAIIGTLLVLLAIFLFGDVLLTLLCRALAVFACFWLAMQFQHRVAALFIDLGLIQRPWLAQTVAFTLLFAVCWRLLRAIAMRVRSGALADSEAVALDAGRIGVVCAIAFALLVSLNSLASDKLLVVSWIWLTILAVLVAGLDVCCPSLLSRATKWFD